MLNLFFVTPRVKASMNEKRFLENESSVDTKKNFLAVKNVQRSNTGR